MNLLSSSHCPGRSAARLSLLAACNKASPGTTRPAPPHHRRPRRPPPDTVVATYGDKKITLGELDEPSSSADQLQEQLAKQKFQCAQSARADGAGGAVKAEAKKGLTEGGSSQGGGRGQGPARRPTRRSRRSSSRAKGQLPRAPRWSRSRPQIVDFLTRASRSRSGAGALRELLQEGRQRQGQAAGAGSPASRWRPRAPRAGPRTPRSPSWSSRDFQCPFCGRGRTTRWSR